MRLLPGTAVIRLFPGAIQVGTDPGYELLLSGLSPTQEEWLMRCGRDAEGRGSRRRHTPPPASQIAARFQVPSECEEIAERLISLGLAHHCGDSGLRLRVSRVEEPTLLAVEYGLSAGTISSCLIDDPRPTGSVPFARSHDQHGTRYVDAWAMSHLEELFEGLPKPMLSGHDLEVRTIPMHQTLCEDLDVFSFPSPRLNVRVGQVSAVIGPLMTRTSPLCPLCLALISHDRRRGVIALELSHEQSTSMALPLKLETTRLLAGFFRDYRDAMLADRLSAFHQVWETQTIHVDAQGRSWGEPVHAHPECNCQDKLLAHF